MKRPAFTDGYRFPVPYRPAAATDIRKTFRRLLREQARKPSPQPTQESKS